MSEETGADDERARNNPLRRTLDLCLFAPVGVAVTVVEDLPELITKGRRRVEREIGNARVVGRFVVNKGHYFGTNYLESEEPGLTDGDKRALIALLKTF